MAEMIVTGVVALVGFLLGSLMTLVGVAAGISKERKSDD